MPTAADGAATTFGINAQKLVFEQDPSEWGRNFAAIQDAGLQTVRIDALWQAAEPEPPVGGRHRYRWQRFDAIVSGLARQRLRWVPVVGYSTDWAGTQRGNHRSPPRDPRLYADFARAVAQRYGRGGDFWRANRRLPYVPVTDYEIWNAPNFRATSFPPAPYARAYIAVRRAIRRADPRASVWVGGLADRAPAFLTAMYEAEPGLKGNVDAVGLHPYADDIAGVLRKTVRLRQTLQFLGDRDVPIAITELGWATAGRSPVPHATDDVRASRFALLSEVLALSNCGVEHFIPHTWVTLQKNRADSEHWFGIVDRDGQATKTGRAYSAAVGRVAGWTREGVPRIPLCER